MSEPSGVVVAGAVGVGVAGVLAGVNTEAAVGALFGALLYITTTRELPLWQRGLFFLTSFVMGYLLSPAVGDLEVFGVHPFAFPGPAAFICSVLVVTLSLNAIKRGALPAQRGQADG